MQVPTGATAPQRPDLRVLRCSEGLGGGEVDGLRVAPVAEVVLTLCRDLGPLDMLVVLDSVLARGLATVRDLEGAARPRRRGAPLHEYDGHHHLDRDRQRADLRRQRRLLAAGWDRRGYSSDDLLTRPVEILRDVDASLGRPHRPSRVQAWTDLLSDSARLPSGRIRLLRRLVPLPR